MFVARLLLIVLSVDILVAFIVEAELLDDTVLLVLAFLEAHGFCVNVLLLMLFLVLLPPSGFAPKSCDSCCCDDCDDCGPFFICAYGLLRAILSAPEGGYKKYMEKKFVLGNGR